LIELKQRNFFHIGYGKAGSSTLQSAFFPKHKEIHFYGISFENFPRADWLTPSARSLCRRVIHPEYWSGWQQADLDDIEHHKSLAYQQNNSFVFSNDHFSLLVAPEWSTQKMKELMPDAHIIVVIRRQQDMLRSIYKFRGHQLVFAPKSHRGRAVKFNNFFEYLYANYENRGGHKARDWIADYLRIIDFKTLIDVYAQAFGEDKVHVLLFEDLASNPDVFYQKLCDVLGVSYSSAKGTVVNASLSAGSIEYLRLKGRLFGRFDFSQSIPGAARLSKLIHSGLKGRGGEIAYSDGQLAALQAIYAAGNTDIAERFGLDLSARGYFASS